MAHGLEWVHVGRWQVIGGLALLLVLAFARAPLRAIPDALFVSDGFGYYVYLPSLLLDGDLDLDNQLGRVPYESQKSYFDRVPRSGLRANPFPVGCAFLWLPFFALSVLAAPVWQAVGADLSQEGFRFAYELPVYAGAFLYGVTGLWLVEKLTAQFFSRTVVAQTLIATLLCSPFAYYLWLEPNMSHVQAAFALALLLFLLWRAMRDRIRRYGAWIAIGTALGIVALVRPYNGLVAGAVLPAIWFACRDEPRPKLAWAGRTAAAAVAAMIVFVPQVLVASTLYGQPMFLPPGTGYDEMHWMQPNVLGLAVSIFSFFPLLAVGFVGLLPGVLGEPRPSVVTEPHVDARRLFFSAVCPLVIVGLLATLYITASYPRGSTFGDSFGQRRIVDWMPIIALGLASSFARVPESRQGRATAALLALALIQIAIAGLYVVGIVPQWGGTAELGLGW